MTHEETTLALDGTGAPAGDSAPKGTEVADSPSGTVESLRTPGLSSRWCTACNQYSTLPEKCDTCGKSDTLGAPPPAEEIIIFENCECGKSSQMVLIQKRVARCFPCFFDEMMTLPCFQCKKHVVEVLVRALGKTGEKDFVGVCVRCLNAHVSTQNN